MKHRYLEITFRNGRPLAAYLYLPRRPGDTSARTERRDHGILVDYAADDRPIGIEITAPDITSLEAINQVLADIHESKATEDELAPLVAT